MLTRYAQAVPLADSWLGHSVAVHLGLVAAGAPHDPTRGFIAGSVQICHGGTSPLEPVYLSGGNDWDSFGTSLTWANDLLVVGAPFIDTTQAAGAGQACFFRFFPDGTDLGPFAMGISPKFRTVGPFTRGAARVNKGGNSARDMVVHLRPGPYAGGPATHAGEGTCRRSTLRVAVSPDVRAFFRRLL